MNKVPTPERDQRTEAALRDKGWSILVIWECEINDVESLAPRIRAFLGENQ